MATRSKKSRVRRGSKPKAVGTAETPLPEGLVERAARPRAGMTMDTETLRLIGVLKRFRIGDRVVVTMPPLGAPNEARAEVALMAFRTGFGRLGTITSEPVPSRSGELRVLVRIDPGKYGSNVRQFAVYQLELFEPGTGAQRGKWDAFTRRLCGLKSNGGAS